MLVTHVSLRHTRTVAADIVEATATATDVIGLLTFDVRIDDNAVALDLVDAYSGEIMFEAATASDAPTVAGVIIAAVVEDTAASSSESIREPGTVAADVAENVTAASSEDASKAAAGGTTTWNPSDKTNVNLSNGNLTATGTAQGGVRGTQSLSSGKYYWEYTLGTFANGNCGVGMADGTATLSNMGATTSHVAVVYPSGSVWFNGGAVSNIASSITTGDVICVAFDITNKLIWFRKGAAGSWNALSGSTNNPATGVGGINTAALTGPWYPAFAPGAVNENVTINVGASAYTGTPPSGFGNLP